MIELIFLFVVGLLLGWLSILLIPKPTGTVDYSTVTGTLRNGYSFKFKRATFCNTGCRTEKCVKARGSVGKLERMGGEK